ncbi:MAG TPA: histidine kinase, partial [Naasia sp.]
MELGQYVSDLQRQLAEAAETGTPEARAVAERLAAGLGAAAQLVLLDALSAAAGEITRDLAPGSIDIRL